MKKVSKKPKDEKPYSEVKVEIIKGKQYLVARRKDGKIKSKKVYEEERMYEDILYYNKERTFKKRAENKNYGKKYTYKSGKIIRYREFNIRTEKARGIKTEDPNSVYIIYIEGWYEKNKTKHYISRSSDSHPLSYPKDKAYLEAEERFYSDASRLMGHGYDEHEGIRLEKGGLIQITNTYISYR
jgi:hypothetical protein